MCFENRGKKKYRLKKWHYSFFCHIASIGWQCWNVSPLLWSILTTTVIYDFKRINSADFGDCLASHLVPRGWILLTDFSSRANMWFIIKVLVQCLPDCWMICPKICYRKSFFFKRRIETYLVIIKLESSSIDIRPKLCIQHFKTKYLQNQVTYHLASAVLCG